MPRGLDHIVHAVHDLDAAAEFYRRVGFTVGARNRHPWGTHNHVVQLPGFFIEILTVAEPEKLGGEGLPQQFGAFNRDAIARGDGFSMLLLESTDISADAADFARTGIGCSPVLPFSREAKMADGTTTTVGFSLTFAREASSPHAGFAACQQHNPSAFWNAAFQTHQNAVSAVSGVILVAKNPLDHAAFLSAFSGVTQLDKSLAGVGVQTPRGDIEIIEPGSFRDRFGVEPKADLHGLKLAGLRVAARDIDHIDALLQRHQIDCQRQRGQLSVPPNAGFGATLIFEDLIGRGID